jgi:hypothetical protein
MARLVNEPDAASFGNLFEPRTLLRCGVRCEGPALGRGTSSDSRGKYPTRRECLWWSWHRRRDSRRIRSDERAGRMFRVPGSEFHVRVHGSVRGSAFPVQRSRFAVRVRRSRSPFEFHVRVRSSGSPFAFAVRVPRSGSEFGFAVRQYEPKNPERGTLNVEPNPELEPGTWNAEPGTFRLARRCLKDGLGFTHARVIGRELLGSR